MRRFEEGCWRGCADEGSDRVKSSPLEFVALPHLQAARNRRNQPVTSLSQVYHKETKVRNGAVFNYSALKMAGSLSAGLLAPVICQARSFELAKRLPDWDGDDAAL